ncbi:MAG: zinc-dependent metalloprotease, partial [Candidatus Geothermincolia bacterium]
MTASEPDRKNAWDESLRRVNRMAEGIARRVPLARSMRDAFKQPGDGFIDWVQAERIAETLAESEGPSEEDAAALQQQFDALAARSQRLVTGFTGMDVDGELGQVRVFDRASWVKANMRGFQIIFEPLSESYRKALDNFARKRKPGGLQKRFLAGMLTIQVGLVMGYLSRNVLGQFDLGIPDPEAPGELYIVLPNMIKTEG